MSKPARFSGPDFFDKTYFVSTDAYEGQFLFQTEAMAGGILHCLYRYREQKKFALHEFVVMPNHIHLLLTPRGITLERAIQLVKGGFSYYASHELAKKFEIWQRGFSDHRIRDAQDYRIHVQYIRNNPVRRGLVSEATEFPFSSAHGDFQLDPPPRYLSG
jgi:REP-associated tyrosine transposase